MFSRQQGAHTVQDKACTTWQPTPEVVSAMQICKHYRILFASF
jgi:hypothetical protein